MIANFWDFMVLSGWVVLCVIGLVIVLRIIGFLIDSILNSD